MLKHMRQSILQTNVASPPKLFSKKILLFSKKYLTNCYLSAIIVIVLMSVLKKIATPGWCNGSTSDSGSFGLGSSPSPGAKWRYGQAAKTSPSQGEIKGSIPFSATRS